MGVLVRRRFIVYLQVGFLFLCGVYFLFAFDQLPTAESLRFPSTQGNENGLKSDPQNEAAAAKTYPAALATILKGVGIPNEPEATSTTTAVGPTATAADSKGEGEQLSEPATPPKVDSEQKESEDDDKKGTDGSDSNDAPSPKPPSRSERLEKARLLMPSILDPLNTSIDRLACPTEINTQRFGYLKADKSEKSIRYFFALNLRECVDLLPRLLGSVMEAIKFLGPEHCALSIVEGNSDDGTYEVLSLLKDELDRLGVVYYLESSRLNPSKGDRIEKLSLLRSMALAPVSGPVEFPRKAFPNSEDLTELEPYEHTGKDGVKVLRTDPNVKKVDLVDGATIIFLNDVAACTEDILELVHQREYQDAHMTCAMDWSHRTDSPLFYDVWVSRAINGDTFFEISANGSWDHAQDLFYNEPVGRVRNEAHRPFQVFACWNGAVAIDAEAIASRKVLFRTVMEGECFQGEPQLFCKDMWWAGFNRIAVVPSINLEYTDKLGRKTKTEKGYTHEFIVKEDEALADAPPLKIDWKGPPDEVKCMPEFNRQSWMPWNETLVDLEA